MTFPEGTGSLARLFGRTSKMKFERKAVDMDEFVLVVLAAGQGKRMRSENSKVVHRVCGKEMVNCVLSAGHAAGCKNAVVVVGHKKEQVIAAVGNNAETVLQAEQLGTGHAVMQARDRIAESENAVIISGDTPLITADTLKAAMKEHLACGNSATVLTTVLPCADGYGRIVRSRDDSVERIVEHKDANEEELKINEINSGIYCFDSAALLNALSCLTANNAQGEYYLTDTLEILKNMGKKIGAYVVKDSTEVLGVNDRAQLAEAEKLMRERINLRHMLGGVTIIDPSSTYIGADVSIEDDTVVYPGAIIEGRTVIGRNVVVGQNCRLVDARIGDGVDIWSSTIISSSVDEGTHVGPYAYIRPDTSVGKNCKVGDFVELKKASIGDGTKLSHLTYVGDAEVGRNVNFGCGTVVVNYDGKLKYRTTIGDNAFIGCNTNLVSPVTVNDGAYIAAGSTITDEVPEGALAIARARQVNKLDWTDRRK